MNSGSTLFAQVMAFVPWTGFSRIVARYDGKARVSTLPCTEHFRIMAYAQLTWRESLRNIEATLSANPTKLYGPRLERHPVPLTSTQMKISTLRQRDGVTKKPSICHSPVMKHCKDKEVQKWRIS